MNAMYRRGAVWRPPLLLDVTLYPINPIKPYNLYPPCCPEYECHVLAAQRRRLRSQISAAAVMPEQSAQVRDKALKRYNLCADRAVPAFLRERGRGAVR